MILGIMQPYLFPYFEHFRLISACDLWIVFDTVKYQRRSWMNRNRLLDRQKGWSYFSVAVSKAEEEENVAKVQLAEPLHWQKKLLDRMRIYEREAPCYAAMMGILKEVVDRGPSHLIDLNVAGLQSVCNYLEITTPIKRLSELDLSLPDACPPGEWALHISKRLGAAEYRNPSGGRDIFDPQQFQDAGIQLSFHEHRSIRYATGSFDFVPDLSVLDPLMWVEKKQLQEWLA